MGTLSPIHALAANGRISVVRRGVLVLALIGCFAATGHVRAQNAPADQTREALAAERDRLDAEALKLQAAGKYAEAIAVGEQILVLERQLGGEDAINVVETIEWLGGVNGQAENWTAATARWTEALAWRELRLGKDHWLTVRARLSVEIVRLKAGATPAQCARLREAAQLSRQYAKLGAAGHYEEAIPLAEQCAAITAEVFGSDSFAHAQDLSHVADLCIAAAAYDRAEALLLESIRIKRRTCGERHPFVADELSGLASLYFARGEYQRALPLLRDALAMQQAAMGSEDFACAQTLKFIANAYMSLSELGQAELCFREAVRIVQKVRGVETPEYAGAIYYLAAVYLQTGDFTRAESLYRESLEIRRRTLNENDPQCALSLNGLGQANYFQNRFEDAKPLFEQALAIQEATIGKLDADYAATLNNLAVNCRALHDYQRAISIYEEVLETKRKVFGDRHPRYATTLRNLAVVYGAADKLDRAVELAEQALAINQAAFGKQQAAYATELLLLGNLYERRGEAARGALPVYRQAYEAELGSLNESAIAKSERGQLLHADLVRSYLDCYLSCLIRLDAPEREGAAYRAALAWKGSTFLRQRASRLAADSPELRTLLQELQSTVSRWAVLTQAAPTDRQQWERQLAELAASKDQLETELAAKSAVYRAATADVTLENLLAALPPDAALVDFLEINFGDPAADKPGNSRGLISSVVFVVRAGHPIEMLSNVGSKLFAEPVDQWRRSFGMGPEGEAAARDLRELLWQPLEPYLGGVRTVLISPEGALGRLPFAAIPGRALGTYLLEDYRLALVPAPRLIPAVISAQAAPPRDREVLLVGDVDYGDAATGPWQPLPGAAAEIQAIGELFHTLARTSDAAIGRLTGPSATEAQFRVEAPGARIVHVATHGFFAGIDASSTFVIDTPLEPGNKQGTAGANSGPPTGRGEGILDGPRPIRSTNPELTSGLIFAGANLPAKQPDATAADSAPADNGILTAAELAFLPLGGVDLVVLSACETGRGEAAGGEGLLGIQRAFQIAGARNTVASLWKVDDEMTRRLMVDFYRNLLEKKQSYLDALRNAQLAMLNELRGRAPAAQPDQQPGGDPNGQLTKLADRGANAPVGAAGGAAASPRFWAAFTFSGDWR